MFGRRDVISNYLSLSCIYYNEQFIELDALGELSFIADLLAEAGVKL